MTQEFTAKTLFQGFISLDRTFEANSTNIIPPAFEVDNIKDLDATTFALLPVLYGDSHHVKIISAHLEITKLLIYLGNRA